MSDWGPWIQHDGKGCPGGGVFAEVEFESGAVFVGFLGTERGEWVKDGEIGVCSKLYRTSSWKSDTGGGFFVPVLRYRVRRPRAFQQLKEMVENLPALEPTK